MFTITRGGNWALVAGFLAANMVLGLTSPGTAWGQEDLRAWFGTKSLEAAQDCVKVLDLIPAGKLREARTTIEAAEKLDPNCPFIVYTKGNVLFDLGEVDLAQAAYKKAFDLCVASGLDLAIETAINMALSYSKTGKPAEACHWYSLAIANDPEDHAKLLWKAYRNLAIDLMGQKQYANAALAAILGRERSPENVERELVQQCIEKATQEGSPEVLRCLFLDSKLPTVTPRSGEAKMETVALAGEAVDQQVTQLLPDPQGRWVVAVVKGSKDYYLLRRDEGTLKVQTVTTKDAIVTACMANSRFYVVVDNPAKVVEVDTSTGNVVESWPLPVAPNSLAVFRSQAMAYFPKGDTIWTLNLKTKQATNTGKPGQMVAGDPREQYLYAMVRDDGDEPTSSILNIDGRTVILTRGLNNPRPTGLLQYYCAGERLMLAAGREAVASNGSEVCVSGDGQWVALPGGGGWRSPEASSLKKAGYVIPVFAVNDLAHVEGVFDVGAYPRGMAINPVTGQVAVVRESEAKVYDMASPKDAVLTVAGKLTGKAAWSGDGRFLVLVGNKELVVYTNALSDAESSRAANWWKKAVPEPLKTPGPANRAATPVAALASFQASARLQDAQKAYADSLKGKSDALPPWDSLSAYTSDKAAADSLRGILAQGTIEASARLYQLKELFKTHAGNVAVKYFLAQHYMLTDQADTAKPLLLEVIHFDKGQTELSTGALSNLAVAYLKANQPVQAAHCVATALGLDRASPLALQVAPDAFTKAGMTTEAAAVRSGQTLGGTAPLDTKLPPLGVLAPNAPTLNPTRLYEIAVRGVVLIKSGGGSGSGAFVGDKATILTSLHVVAANQAIQVFPFDLVNGKTQRGQPIKATIIARDAAADVAILRLEKPVANAIALAVAQAAPPAGQKVYAVGNPGLADQTLDLTMTDGIISANNRVVDGQTYLQHTAGVNPGNSGGPLLNERGEIEGIVCLNSKLKSVSFATPVSVVFDVFRKNGNLK